MRSRTVAAASLVVFMGLGIAWGGLSAAARNEIDPTPSATTQVGFTVPGTASPTPTPSSSGSGGGGSTGGSGGGGSTGGSDGTTPPACVPTTKTPHLTPDPAASPAPLRLNRHTAAQGGDVVITADGFQSGEKVVVALYSSPVKLGTFTVRSTGGVYAVVTIPRPTQLGTHTIQVTGFLDCRVAAATIHVVSPRGSGASVFPWIVWLIAGGAVGLSVLAILIAFLLRWFPSTFVVGVAAKAAS